jgi:hypothetical protein
MNTVPTRPYTHKELASLYQVSWPTLKKWIEPYLDEIGEKIGHFYTIKQVEIIFQLVGRPDLVEKKSN